MYFIIRETYNRITSIVDTFCPKPIILLLIGVIVVLTIYLYHKILLDADEVGYKVSYRMLTSEMIATLLFPECIPENRLTFGHCPAVNFCELFQ